MTVTPAIAKAIQSVIDYDWEGELRDFQNNHRLGDGSANENHVFRDLVVLDNFLHHRESTPESYLQEEPNHE